MSEGGPSVAKKDFVPSNTADRHNELVLNNFDLLRSRVAVKESLPDDVLSTDDPKLLCFCLCKYVSNTALCNKWALNDFESWKFTVAVGDSFSDEALLSDSPKVLCSCICKYVSKNVCCNQWALNNFESWRSRVAVEESFSMFC